MGLAIGIVGGMVMFCILMIHNVCIEVKRIAEALERIAPKGEK